MSTHGGRELQWRSTQEGCAGSLGAGWSQQESYAFGEFTFGGSSRDSATHGILFGVESDHLADDRQRLAGTPARLNR
jgi:hypothetical protein